MCRVETEKGRGEKRREEERRGEKRRGEEIGDKRYGRIDARDRNRYWMIK